MALLWNSLLSRALNSTKYRHHCLNQEGGLSMPSCPSDQGSD